MAHIVYGGKSYPFPTSELDAMRASISQVLRDGGFGELALGSTRDGVDAYLYVTPGTPIAVHSWDPDEEYPWKK